MRLIAVTVDPAIAVQVGDGDASASGGDAQLRLERARHHPQERRDVARSNKPSTKSIFPSPFRSAAEMEPGPSLDAKRIGAWNVPSPFPRRTKQGRTRLTVRGREVDLSVPFR